MKMMLFRIPNPGWVIVCWMLSLVLGSSVVAQTAPKPFVPLRRPAERQVIYASGSNGITIYIKNREVLAEVNRDKASSAKVGLKEGDVIAVKNADRFDINCFWLSCLSSNKEFLFQTSEKWTSYLPTDPKKWWETKSVKDVKPAQPAPDSQEYVKLAKKSAAETPLYVGAQPIRSVSDSGERATYLYYIVSREDLLPKDAPPKP